MQNYMPKRFCAAAFALLLLSCSDITGPSGDAPTVDIRRYVTGDAEAALTAEGRFVYPIPEPIADIPIISPADAYRLANALFRDCLVNRTPFVPNTNLYSCIWVSRLPVELAACSPVRWNEVSLSHRWFYGEPPIGSLPATLPAYVHNAFGPMYFFPMVHAGRVIATIGVAAHATNITIDGDGRMRVTSDPYGDEFSVFPRFCAAPAGSPPTGEDAVYFAATVTDRKVVSVPRLILPSFRVAQAGARWRIALDRPVEVVSYADGTEHTVDTLYVSAWQNFGEAGLPPGAQLRLMIPVEVQPTGETVLLGGGQTVFVGRRDGLPMVFAEVALKQ